ncbi:MAG TPA: hypothetical protein VEM15_13860 [Thermodesulfobacteriota bacterium]|nr:hypothetical protein [Thermodesulfobacteriota bacterium]
MDELLSYKGLIVDSALLLILWGAMWLSIKGEVRKRVGKYRFDEILKEYKRMVRDRIFGGVGIVVSIIFYWCFHISFQRPIILPPITESFLANALIFILPFAMVCGVLYCYFMAFIKAMSNFLGSSKE